MAAISFDFIADLRRFLPGARQVSSGLEDIETDLRDVAAAGDRLDREMDAAFTSMRTGASRTGTAIKNDIGESTRRAGDTAKEGMSEVGSELAENLSEGFQSGDFLGVATETSASLTQGLAGLGPLGVAGGVGAGVVSLIVSNMKARADRIKAIGVQFGESLGNAMADGITRAELRTEVVEALKSSLEETGMTFGQFAKLVTDSGLSMDEVIAALATGGKGMQEVLDVLNRITEAGTHQVKGRQHSVTVLTDEAKAAKGLSDKLKELDESVVQGVDSAVAYADAMDGGRKTAADWRRELDKVRASYGKLGPAANAAADEVIAAAKRARAGAQFPDTGSASYQWWYYAPDSGRRGTPRNHMRDGRR